MTAIPPQLLWPYVAAIVFTLLATIVLARDHRSLHGRRLLFALGPMCIAVPMAVFGADHLSDAINVMRIVPKWMPGRLFWAYFVGVCLVAAALSIVVRVQLKLSSILLGSMLLSFVVLMHIPNTVAKPDERLRWMITARDLVFGCGALTLGITQGKRSTRGERAVLAMQFVIAAIAIFFGVESLLNPRCVPGIPLQKQMPDWIPLSHVWTPLSGVGLILGGLAMFVPRTRQIAAEFMGLLVLLMVLLIYVPIMIAKPDVESLNYVFDTLVLAGTFLVAASAVAPVEPSRVDAGGVARSVPLFS